MITTVLPPVPLPKYSFLPIWSSGPTPCAQICLLLRALLCGKSPLHAVRPAVSGWTWVLCTHCCVLALLPLLSLRFCSETRKVSSEPEEDVPSSTGCSRGISLCAWRITRYGDALLL